MINAKYMSPNIPNLLILSLSSGVYVLKLVKNVSAAPRPVAVPLRPRLQPPVARGISSALRAAVPLLDVVCPLNRLGSKFKLFLFILPFLSTISNTIPNTNIGNTTNPVRTINIFSKFLTNNNIPPAIPPTLFIINCIIVARRLTVGHSFIRVKKSSSE